MIITILLILITLILSGFNIYHNFTTTTTIPSTTTTTIPSDIFSFSLASDDVVLPLSEINVSGGWVTPGFNTSNPLQYTVETEVNTNLGTGDFYKYVTEFSNPHFEHKVYFKPQSSNTKKHPSAMVIKDWLITQSPQDLRYGHDSSWSTIDRQASDTAVIDSESYSIRYNSQWGDGLDLKYSYQTYEVKEELIINSLSDIPTQADTEYLLFKTILRAYNLSNQVEGEGMRVKFDGSMLDEEDVRTDTDKSFVLTTSDSEEILFMSDLIVYDSNGHSTSLNYNLEVTRFGNIYIELIVPYMFLNNDSTVYPVTIDPSWTSPSTVYAHSSEEGSPAQPANNAIDGNTGSKWQEEGVAFGELTAESGSSYDWFITLDMGNTLDISSIKIYADADTPIFNAPCKVAVVKVCDDAACSGESDLMTSDCAFSTTLEWQECSFTETTGRWLRVEGGVWDDNLGSCSNIMSTRRTDSFYELEVYTAVSSCYDGLTDAGDWTYDSADECVVTDALTDAGGDILVTGGGSLIFEEDILMASGGKLRYTIGDSSSIRRREDAKIRILV